VKLSIFALTLIVATSIAASTASAGSISAPSELNPGDQFRIVFVTDGTTKATSSAFSTYDNLVQSEASGTTYNGHSITWKAIVGTSTVSALDHIGETTTSSIPIFLVDGTKVTASDNTSGLWSGTLLHSINLDLLGAVPTGSRVWTGANYTGAISGLPVGNSGNNVGHGDTTSTGHNWAIAPGLIQKTSLLHLYGISEVLTVPQSTAAVPEPSTAMLAGLGGLVALAYSLKRKRN
jgi:hypothetical protein